MNQLTPDVSQLHDTGSARDDALVQAVGRQTTITVHYGGVQREVTIVVPSRYVPGTPLPLVFALHGGSGDASVMYAGDKRIVVHAERDGFIAVFPNGLPMPDKPESRNYYWAIRSIWATWRF